MISYCLDAHTLVWHLEDNPKLGGQARTILNTPDVSLILPSIALAEACFVVSRGRTSLVDWQSVIQVVQADPRVEIAPLDAAVIERAMGLPPSLEMHDAQILATALLHCREGNDVVLLTRDETLAKCGLIRVTW